MSHPTLNAILHLSDQMIAAGLIVPANAAPERVSAIQVALEKIAKERPSPFRRPWMDRRTEIAHAKGSAA
jgi:hypothetical protein